MKKISAVALVSVVQTKQLSRRAAESQSVRGPELAVGGNKGLLGCDLQAGRLSRSTLIKSQSNTVT